MGQTNMYIACECFPQWETFTFSGVLELYSNGLISSYYIGLNPIIREGWSCYSIGVDGVLTLVE